MGAVESDSVKSARKAKDKLHKVCERASETLHGQEQNRMHIASMRESQDSVWFSNQHTSTITCTAAPRVWHFSAFHYTRKHIIMQKHSSLLLLRSGILYSIVSFYTEYDIESMECN